MNNEWVQFVLRVESALLRWVIAAIVAFIFFSGSPSFYDVLYQRVDQFNRYPPGYFDR